MKDVIKLGIQLGLLAFGCFTIEEAGRSVGRKEGEREGFKLGRISGYLECMSDSLKRETKESKED